MIVGLKDSKPPVITGGIFLRGIVLCCPPASADLVF